MRRKLESSLSSCDGPGKADPEEFGVNGGIRAVGLSPGKRVGVSDPEDGVNKEAQDFGPDGGDSGGGEFARGTVFNESLGNGGLEGLGAGGNCAGNSCGIDSYIFSDLFGAWLGLGPSCSVGCISFGMLSDRGWNSVCSS